MQCNGGTAAQEQEMYVQIILENCMSISKRFLIALVRHSANEI
jgi:hypothetical protein